MARVDRASDVCRGYRFGFLATSAFSSVRDAVFDDLFCHHDLLLLSVFMGTFGVSALPQVVGVGKTGKGVFGIRCLFIAIDQKPLLVPSNVHRIDHRVERALAHINISSPSMWRADREFGDVKGCRSVLAHRRRMLITGETADQFL